MATTSSVLEPLKTVQHDTIFFMGNVIDSIKNITINKLPDDNFWLNSILLPVILILFGAFLPILFNLINRIIFRTQLKITHVEVSNENFVPEYSNDKKYCGLPNYEKPLESAFYLHLLVENKGAPAEHVRIMVTNVEIVSDCKDYNVSKLKSIGPIPLIWQYEYVNKDYSTKLPIIGPPRYCDLFRVTKTDGFKLQTLINIPNINYQLPHRFNSKIKVTVCAYAEGKEYKPQTFTLEWTGIWSDDVVKLRKQISFTC